MNAAFKLVMATAACLLWTLIPLQNARGAHEGSPRAAQGTEALLSRLQDAGLAVHLTYTGEAKRGSDLIPDNTTEYRGLVELSLDFDTHKLGLWQNGRFFIDGQNGHGQGLNITPGGNFLPVSNIDAGNFTQISQYGLDQGMLNNRLRLVAGKQDVNNFFCVNDFGGQFFFPSFTLIPTVPLPTFPAPALGLTLLSQPSSRIDFSAGIYDGAPEIGTSGWDTTFDGRGGYFIIVEPAWNPVFGDDGGYGGRYRIGVWYHSGQFADLRQPDSQSGNYGIYVMVNQLVYKASASNGTDQGLGLFFQLGWAPEDRNAVNRHIGFGFTYTGLLPGRDQDAIGFGVSYARLTGQSPGREDVDLTSAELYYSAQIGSALILQPDIQYFSNPGDDHENGWAAAIRWVLSF